jgi:RNA polymerase primary sigma factor
MPLPKRKASRETEAGEQSLDSIRGRSADSSLRQYLKEISRIPLLKPEEERRIAYRIRRGNLEAKEALVSANLRLVVFVAKKFSNRGLSLLDLIEEGNLGLIRAAEKYQPSRGFRFSTYATWWIRQSIQRGLANQSATVRVPVHIAEAVSKMLRAQEKIATRMGREPSLIETAKQAGMSPERVSELMKVSQHSVSLDAKLPGDDSNSRFSDFLSDESKPLPEESVLLELETKRLMRLMKRLSEKERGVLEARYGLGEGRVLTLEETGERFSLTRERIRQIEVTAKRKLLLLYRAESKEA